MSAFSLIVPTLNRYFLSKMGLILSRPLVNGSNEIEYFFDKFDKADYTRVMTLNLICNEIKQNKIEGNLAEVGVFQGKFSRLMSKAFPNKKIYLYDTFEGFDDSFFKTDFEKNQKSLVKNDFNNTSVDIVLSNMPDRELCIIRKGFFPSSIEETDKHDKFSLVSLDCDLYQPIFDGLEFFFPRMEKGGYILIHDYNNAQYLDCKTAVKEFCKKRGLNIVPLCDGWGSAVLAI